MLLNLYQFRNYRAKIKNYNTFISALEDTITIKKNKNNQYVSTISALTAESAKTFAKLDIKNKEVKELQNTIKEYKYKVETLTKFKSQIIVDTVTNTVVEYIQGELPTYKWKFKDEWIDLSGVSKEANTQFSLEVTNKYDVALYEKKKQYKIDITNYNPYSKTTNIQSFYKSKPRQKRVGIGPYIGYGYNNGFGFQAGIGITYNILYLW